MAPEESPFDANSWRSGGAPASRPHGCQHRVWPRRPTCLPAPALVPSPASGLVPRHPTNLPLPRYSRKRGRLTTEPTKLVRPRVRPYPSVRALSPGRESMDRDSSTLGPVCAHPPRASTQRIRRQGEGTPATASLLTNRTRSSACPYRVALRATLRRRTCLGRRLMPPARAAGT